MLLKQEKANKDAEARWYYRLGKFFKHGCLKFPSIFLISEKKSIWLLLYKKDHIIKKYYLTTENLSTFTESILLNLEETS